MGNNLDDARYAALFSDTTAAGLRRREFIKQSSLLAGAVAAVTSGLIGLYPRLRPTPIEHSSSVWAMDDGPNSWNEYYTKFLRLMDVRRSGLELNWMRANSVVLLDMDVSPGRRYPYSVDPKLLYSVLRYLTQERAFNLRNIKIQARLIGRLDSHVSDPAGLLRSSGLIDAFRSISIVPTALDWTFINDSNFQDQSLLANIDHAIRLKSLAPLQDFSDIGRPIESKTRLSISSATKLLVEDPLGNLQVVNRRPGVIFASTSDVAHTLASHIYNRQGVADLELTNHISQAGAAPHQSSINAVYSEAKGILSIASAAHLSSIKWRHDVQHAPIGHGRCRVLTALDRIGVQRTSFS